MPYKIVKGSGPKPWKIVITSTGKVVGSSKTKKEASASIRAREAAEHGNKAETKPTTVSCECIKCGNIMQTERHCIDIKCPKCGGSMRRKERPGPGK